MKGASRIALLALACSLLALVLSCLNLFVTSNANMRSEANRVREYQQTLEINREIAKAVERTAKALEKLNESRN